MEEVSWTFKVLVYLQPYFQSIHNHARDMVVIVVVCGLAQTLFPAIRRKAKFYSYEFWLDVAYSFQPSLLRLTFFGAGIGAGQAFLRDHTPILFPGLQDLPFVLRVVVAVWAFDFLVYWRHRLSHQVAFLWPIHAVHHTSRKIDFLTTLRLHPLEVMAGGVLNGWLFARIGLDGAALSTGFAVYLYYNYFIHTNIPVRYPGFLRYVFVSPFMHRWHHATDVEARNTNFGVVFAWNDWLFGSAYHPDHEPSEFGLVQAPGEAPLIESYVAHVIYPFRVAWNWLTAPAPDSDSPGTELPVQVETSAGAAH